MKNKLNIPHALTVLLLLLVAGRGVVYASKHNTGTHADSITIAGTLRGAVEGIDTVTLFVWKSMPTHLRLQHSHVSSFQQKVTNGNFQFTFKPGKDIVFISLAYDKWNGTYRHLFREYVSQRGDSIQVIANFTKSTNLNAVSDSGLLLEIDQLSFIGKGSGKYNMWKIAEKQAGDLSAEYHAWQQALSDDIGLQKLEMKDIFDRYCYISDTQLKWINRFKPVCSPALFQVLRNELLAQISYTYLYRPLVFAVKQHTGSDAAACLSTYNELVRGVPLPDTSTANGASASYRFLEYGLCRASVESKLTEKPIYPSIKDQYTGLLRERLLTNYLTGQYSHLPADTAQTYLKDALQLAKSLENQQSLLALQQLEIGATVYNFSLPDKHGNFVSLADFRGKVVFIDFFYTGCSNCASYFKKSVKPAKDHFKNNRDVVFMSISIDGNRDKWLRSVESGLYTSGEAINLYTDGQGARHPIIESLKIWGYPHPLLIDREGKIFNNRYKELGQNDPPGLVARINEALSR